MCTYLFHCWIMLEIEADSRIDCLTSVKVFSSLEGAGSQLRSLRHSMLKKCSYLLKKRCNGSWKKDSGDEPTQPILQAGNRLESVGLHQPWRQSPGNVHRGFFPCFLDIIGKALSWCNMGKGGGGTKSIKLLGTGREGSFCLGKQRWIDLLISFSERVATEHVLT